MPTKHKPKAKAKPVVAPVKPAQSDVSSLLDTPDPFGDGLSDLNKGLSDGVTANTVPATHKNKGGRFNAPRDPVTGQLLPLSEPGPPMSLQDAAQEAFNALGGKKWLKKQAREFPKEFMSLLARTQGEDGVSAGVAYVAMPIPVEVREVSDGVLETLPDPFE